MFKYVLYLLKKQLFKIVPIKSWRKKLKNTLPAEYKVKRYSKKELAYFHEILEKYPAVMSAEETLKIVVEKKLSFSRIGDGEFNLIIDEGNIFNQNDDTLKQRLKQICEEMHSKDCLVCLNNYRCQSEWKKSANDWNKWFLYHGLFTLPRVLSTVKFKKQNFGDAYFLCKTLNQKSITTIKSIWQNRKILFVCNEASLCQDDVYDLFNNVKEKKFLFVPAKDAFNNYNEILKEIKTYTSEWIIYLECGATASVLSWDLAQMGYRALDMGDYYKRLLNHEK